MILGFHFIFSAYGFWLPNDPRGSWSESVRRYELLRFGPATKVTTTRSLAAKNHDRALRLKAKSALKFSPVRFDGGQALQIAKGFNRASEEGGYRVLALAVMPDHTHLLMAGHPRPLDQIASHLKAKATRALGDAGVNPMARFVAASGRIPSPWARKYWCPFVHDEPHMHRAVKYVNDNPIKAGLPQQRWSFVRPYRG